MYVIGVDVGTSGVKSTVFGDGAQVLAHAYREYNLISAEEGHFELDPHILLSCTLDVLAESTKELDGEKITAISVTSFGESFVLMDEQDEILGNTMIYMDQRGIAETREFAEQIPEREIFATTGQMVDKMIALYKLRWLKKHQPKRLQKAQKISFVADFITHRLGADHICEYSLAARSGMFDIEHKQWWAEAVEFAGISPDMLPRTVKSGSTVGTLSPHMAKRLCMSEDVNLIVGGHDQILAAIGSGARAPGDIANGMGTVDCMISIMQGDANIDKLLEYKLAVVPYLEDDTYAIYAFNMSGGGIIKWFRDTLAKDIAHLPDAYELLNGEVPKEPTGLLTLPYFAGGGTPYMDAETPAAVTGMRLSTTRGDLFRAFMEGAAYEMRLNIDCLKDAGVEVGKIITVGGGAKSPIWMQIRADVFNQAVHVGGVTEAGTLGSAMLCYVSTGVYEDIPAAQADLVSSDTAFHPQAENVEIYNTHFIKYKELYNHAKALYKP